MLGRCALLAILVTFKGGQWLIEQPITSLADKCRRFVGLGSVGEARFHALSLIGVQQVVFAFLLPSLAMLLRRSEARPTGV
jgi:hypothetical protein